VLLNPSLVVYGDSQTQNSEPIPEQPPTPGGSFAMKLSWDRDKGWMKVAMGKGVWYFKELLGHTVITGTDAEVGRIHLYGEAWIDGETLVLSRSPDSPLHPLVEGTELDHTYNRMCYFRDQKIWRLRDENKTAKFQAEGRNVHDPEVIRYVASYEGDGFLSWRSTDPYAHCYHLGRTVIDVANVAHLYDPDEVYS